MDRFQIYLSGGMQNFGKEHFDKSNEWRNHVQAKVKEYNRWVDTSALVTCFNPNDLYSFDDENIEDSQLTIMQNDLWYLKHSDLVLVNFNDPKSLGTMAEIAIAYDRDIPIIGICENTNMPLHPWQENFCRKILFDVDTAVDYIYNTYVGLI